MIRLTDIKLGLDEDEKALADKAAKKLKVDKKDINEIKIVKKAIDARDKNNIKFVYTVDVATPVKVLGFSQAPEEEFEIPKAKRKSQKRVVIAGSGPAGLFCAYVLAKAGLAPVVIERGKDIDRRKADVESFWKGAGLDENSNVQFGEGGAGTFSDGKLNTGISDPLVREVLKTFYECGAPEEILYINKPHIGTDKLQTVVKNLRQKIISLGGEVRFETALSDLVIEKGRLIGVLLSSGEFVDTDTLVLAIGHSARDTFLMLHRRGLVISPKPFSVGVRIEHKQSMINKSQYGKFYNHKKLGAADYKLSCKSSLGRGVYTFCMCPGGYVVAASSEKGGVVTNGMSEYSRDGENANSALLVSVTPGDFPGEDPFLGMYFQRELEKRAFAFGGYSYKAPCQLVGDFLKGIPLKAFYDVFPTYQRGVEFVSLDDFFNLPNFYKLNLAQNLKDAIIKLDRKLNGFAAQEAVLTAVETRSSSPIRIMRDCTFQSNISGVYPCGEGAGYAGGITSSAVDGIKCALKIIENPV